MRDARIEIWDRNRDTVCAAFDAVGMDFEIRIECVYL